MSARDSFQAANPDFVASIRRSTLGMPVAKMFGVDFENIGPGHLDAVLPYREELSFRPGFFQGTIVSSLAYFAATSSLGTLLPADRIGMTLDHHVKFLAPAEGERLIARGRVVKQGRTVGVGSAEVYAVRDGRETLCATAMVTTSNVERMKKA